MAGLEMLARHSVEVIIVETGTPAIGIFLASKLVEDVVGFDIRDKIGSM